MIMNGDSEALLELVERGSGSETEPSDEGWIALHEAAYYGQLECVTILIGGEQLQFLVLPCTASTP